MIGSTLLDWASSPLMLVGFVVAIYGVLRLSRSIESRSAPPVSKYALEQYAKAHGGTGKERRRYPRRASDSIAVEIQTGGEEHVVPGQVVDYSQGGLGLIADEEIEVGKYVKVRAPSGSSPDWIAAEVRYCVRGKKGWTLGCMFLEKVPWRQMQQFSA